MKIGAIVQARMSSQRCPGKVLRPLAGRPLLQYLIERVRQSPVHAVVIATSTDSSDQPIEEFCRSAKVDYFRGSLDNVAHRFAQTLEGFPFDAFVRVNADAPLLDPDLIRRGVDLFQKGGADLVTNVHPRSFPKGQSVEIIQQSVFVQAEKSAIRSAEDREHVMTYFYRNEATYKIRNFSAGEDYQQVRLCVDTEEDFAVLEKMVQKMRKPHGDYGWKELVALRKEAVLS